jgi:type II secretory pathway pseudopilin PulG
MNRRRNAFTLVELLVVIAIIIVLMGILIPAVSQIRKHQQTASSRAQMSRIQFGITAYHADFQAYPGGLANREFTSSKTPGLTIVIPNSTVGDLTQSEDLYACLVGGWRYAGTTLTFEPADMGMGPTGHNPNAAAAKRYNAYIENRVGESTPLVAGQPKPIGHPDLRGVLDMSYVKDTAIPEFLDQYTSQRPILYMRAMPGAKQSANNIIYNGKASGYNPEYNYNFSAIAGYSNMNGTPPPAGKQDWSGTLPTSVPSVNYFTSSSSSLDTAKNARYAGSFIMISAGADRVYGTTDDLIVGGGGGQ